jgi:hypothetical protein
VSIGFDAKQHNDQPIPSKTPSLYLAAFRQRWDYPYMDVWAMAFRVHQNIHGLREAIDKSIRHRHKPGIWH